MAPKPWTNEEQYQWLHTHVGKYLDSKVTGDQINFFVKLDETWFSKWPAEEACELPARESGSDLTDVQEEQLGKYIERRKKQLREWFRNHTQKARGSGDKPAKKDDTQSLAATLWKVDERHRDPQLIELWHKKYPEKGKAALEAAGYYAKHAGDIDWVGQKGAMGPLGIKEKMKQQSSARMAMWRRVTIAVFAGESDKVKDEMAEELRRFQAAKLEGKGPEQRTPESAQLSLDQLEAIVRRLHMLIAEKTGWVGISLFGGPTPNDGGNLNFTLLSSGVTPAGNNFPDSHPNREQDVGKRFSEWLRRCFSRAERDAMALQSSDILDDLLAMPDESKAGVGIDKPAQTLSAIQPTHVALSSSPPSASVLSSNTNPLFLPPNASRQGTNSMPSGPLFYAAHDELGSQNGFLSATAASWDPHDSLARAASPLADDDGWGMVDQESSEWFGPPHDNTSPAQTLDASGLADLDASGLADLNASGSFKSYDHPPDPMVLPRGMGNTWGDVDPTHSLFLVERAVIAGPAKELQLEDLWSRGAGGQYGGGWDEGAHSDSARQTHVWQSSGIFGTLGLGEVPPSQANTPDSSSSQTTMPSARSSPHADPPVRPAAVPVCLSPMQMTPPTARPLPQTTSSSSTPSPHASPPVRPTAHPAPCPSPHAPIRPAAAPTHPSPMQMITPSMRPSPRVDAPVRPAAVPARLSPMQTAPSPTLPAGPRAPAQLIPPRCRRVLHGLGRPCWRMAGPVGTVLGDRGDESDENEDGEESGDKEEVPLAKAAANFYYPKSRPDGQSPKAVKAKAKAAAQEPEGEGRATELGGAGAGSAAAPQGQTAARDKEVVEPSDVEPAHNEGATSRAPRRKRLPSPSCRRTATMGRLFLPLDTPPPEGTNSMRERERAKKKQEREEQHRSAGSEHRGAVRLGHPTETARLHAPGARAGQARRERRAPKTANDNAAMLEALARKAKEGAAKEKGVGDKGKNKCMADDGQGGGKTKRQVLLTFG
ncbi:hypothetical protein B0H17DRAFT_1220106 [Mycena rosella]|uniref:Uncharacterized protein n=1 Tax=Mycena rosella TaxID=1033263 RepID=A0AAD7FDH8_MYCRO|nr:hypothetical protein B0H17DRAFT_1220106 [Mycena rosella]